jgi:N-acetylated-alpha-linked acidic dipeptidase
VFVFYLDHTRILSKNPHIAGSPRNKFLAEMIKDRWEEAGLDDVKLTPYDVLLSYPEKSDPNFIELLDGRGQTLYRSPLTEAILTPGENQSDVVPPFNAYSAPGDIQVHIRVCW